jgi:hypothetical protein
MSLEFALSSRDGSSGMRAQIDKVHYDFKPRRVHVTVLPAGLTETAVLGKFGFDPKTWPLKPMSVEQCVADWAASTGVLLQISDITVHQGPIGQDTPARGQHSKGPT